MIIIAEDTDAIRLITTTFYCIKNKKYTLLIQAMNQSAPSTNYFRSISNFDCNRLLLVYPTFYVF